VIKVTADTKSIKTYKIIVALNKFYKKKSFKMLLITLTTNKRKF